MTGAVNYRGNDSCRLFDVTSFALWLVKLLHPNEWLLASRDTGWRAEAILDHSLDVVLIASHARRTNPNHRRTLRYRPINPKILWAGEKPREATLAVERKKTANFVLSQCF